MARRPAVKKKFFDRVIGFANFAAFDHGEISVFRLRTIEMASECEAVRLGEVEHIGVCENIEDFGLRPQHFNLGESVRV